MVRNLSHYVGGKHVDGVENLQVLQQGAVNSYSREQEHEADELGEDSLEELKARRAEAQSSSVDVDETDFNENLELPGADLSGEELTVRVLPKQEDEFTCSRCFLVHHRSQLAKEVGGLPVCTECAA